MSFTNRLEAGRRLAQALASYKDRHPVILALPRGGVPVAAEVAAALDAPLDLILVRKIGVPEQPELAMGAVVDGAAPIVVRNDDVIRRTGIDESEFKAACDRELAEIERRRARYVGGRPRIDVPGRTVIVVDDGIATGATTRAALRALRRRKPSRLVLAVPVAPTDTLAAMEQEADQIVCLEDHSAFGAIGFFYADFRQTTDREVTDALARCCPSRDSDAENVEAEREPAAARGELSGQAGDLKPDRNKARLHPSPEFPPGDRMARLRVPPPCVIGRTGSSQRQLRAQAVTAGVSPILPRHDGNA
jgi:putative phosphoribosyl transferase